MRGIVGQVGELVEHDLGAEAGQHLDQRVRVEHITEHWHRAKLAQQVGFVR
jgi:hypothetical protein